MKKKIFLKLESNQEGEEEGEGDLEHGDEALHEALRQSRGLAPRQRLAPAPCRLQGVRFGVQGAGLRVAG
jgi:hypothetical protein